MRLPKYAIPAAIAIACGALFCGGEQVTAFAQTKEHQMGNIAVQLSVGDYAKWRPVFDKYRPVRDKAGVTSERVFRNADDPNQVMVWWETPDTTKVLQVLQSEEVKGYMKEAGVVAPPKIHVVP
jgi:hypothetical protein